MSTPEIVGVAFLAMELLVVVGLLALGAWHRRSSTHRAGDVVRFPLERARRR